MSKNTRKARAAGAIRGTVAADHRIEIDDRVDPNPEMPSREERTAVPAPGMRRTVEDEVAHLQLFVRKTTRGDRVRIWRSSDGLWWRIPGAVRIQRWPTPDGERAFVLTLYKGANADDIEFLLRAVADARTGKGFETLWRPLVAPWADDLTFLFKWARRYNDPFTHSDTSPRVSPCTDAKCVDVWHDDFGMHHLDGVSRRLPERRGKYEIRVVRHEGEPWNVDVFTDEFYGTPEDVTAFVNDLTWMQEECRRANLPNEVPALVGAV